MQATKPNKHELKTSQTRSLLLRAAETIFVRDGYEGADLGEIAAAAGRTKGAIYAHYKSKEDIFLALAEEKMLQYRQRMEERMADIHDTERNRQFYREFCLNLIEEPAWALLLLEFKLYVIRHPESREHLLNLYAKAFAGKHEQKVDRLLGPVDGRQAAVGRDVAVRTLQPLLSSLAIEAIFAPVQLDLATCQKVASLVFDALVPPGAQ